MVKGGGDSTGTASEDVSLASEAAATRPARSPPPPDQALAELRPGDCLGRYTVGPLIGAGGMGWVYRAVDGDLGRPVALKVIRPDRASAGSRARLIGEAQALARLHHPNVVTVYEVAAHGEQLFVAMELVPGTTLRQWLHARPRGWREVRDAFVAAGHGLAAAHAAGIVHRDFKPHNIIVGDERVVVVDFGLARAGAEPQDGAADAGSGGQVLGVGLTLTGQQVGTPAYMAPEQRAGGAVTARSDQYSFCVALHEALYGTLPVAGSVPAASGEVPRFVAATLARGLSVDPAARWPEMEALIAALGRQFWTPGRRRLAAGLGLAVVAAVGTVAFTAGRRIATPDPCAGAETMTASLWDDGVRDRVRAAFAKTGRPFAVDAFARVDAAVQNKLVAWARAHRETCEATAVRHEQSGELLDLRMDCLGKARDELAALATLLADADGAAVDRAVPAAAAAGEIGVCSDLAALRQSLPPPRDAGHALELANVRAELARLTTMGLLGRVKDGQAIAAGVIAAARKLGYAPLLAEALFQAGRLDGTAGETARALDEYYAATRAAGEAHDDHLAARSWSEIESSLGGGKRHFESAEVAYRSALAAAARAGNQPADLALICRNHALALRGASRWVEELPVSLLCLSLDLRLHGPVSSQFAGSLCDLADVLADLGHQADAIRLFRRALPVAERAVGPDHPIVTKILNNTGKAFLEIDDFEAAGELFERVLAIKERVYGADSPTVFTTVQNLGIVRLRQRRLPEARALFERTIRLRIAKLGPAHPLLATSYEVLADVAHLEGHATEALADLDRALAIFRAGGDEPTPEWGDVYRDEAGILLRLGRFREARAALVQAQQIDDKTLPAEDFVRAGTYGIRANLDLAEGHVAAAIPGYRRSIEIVERSQGPRCASLVDPLSGLSAALLRSGDAAGARAAAERAVAIVGSAVDEKAWATLRLAQARYALGDDQASAVALVRATRAELAALPYPAAALPEIDRWLARPDRR